MRLDASNKDKFLISKIRNGTEVGFIGGITSSDPESCWISLSPDDSKEPWLSIIASRLPNEARGRLPEFVKVLYENGRSIIRLPIINIENDRAIRLGRFKNIQSVYVQYSADDWLEMKRSDGSESHHHNSIPLDFELSETLSIYRIGYLKKLRGNKTN